MQLLASALILVVVTHCGAFVPNMSQDDTDDGIGDISIAEMLYEEEARREVKEANSNMERVADLLKKYRGESTQINGKEDYKSSKEILQTETNMQDRPPKRKNGEQMRKRFRFPEKIVEHRIEKRFTFDVAKVSKNICHRNYTLQCRQLCSYSPKRCRKVCPKIYVQCFMNKMPKGVTTGQAITFVGYVVDALCVSGDPICIDICYLGVCKKYCWDDKNRTQRCHLP